MKNLKTAAITELTHRLIASRYPTVGVFDDLTSDPSDLRDAFILESFTNDRLALPARRITSLPTDEIITGSGASIVMAAFLHADEKGGRFTDARLGGWYAALDIKTAIAETVHHNTSRLRKSEGGFPNRIQMRELIAKIDTQLVDIRGEQASFPELYNLNDYTKSQAFAAELKWPTDETAANGIVFDSVRNTGGTNVCIFWPSKVMRPVIQGDHFEYIWDSKGNIEVMVLKNISI